VVPITGRSARATLDEILGVGDLSELEALRRQSDDSLLAALTAPAPAPPAYSQPPKVQTVFQIPPAVEATLEGLIDKMGDVFDKVHTLEGRLDGLEAVQSRMADFLESESDRATRLEVSLSRLELNEELNKNRESELMIDLGGYKASLTASLAEVLERLRALESRPVSAPLDVKATLSPTVDADTVDRLRRLESRLAGVEARGSLPRLSCRSFSL